MNGFSGDALSILKHNNMVHEKSLGFVSGIGLGNDVDNLLLALSALGLKVTGKKEKGVLWDYIIVPKENTSTRNILSALSSLNSGGLIILQLDEKHNKYQDRYLRLGTGVSATKVNYDDRYYLVIHPGDDYGN